MLRASWRSTAPPSSHANPLSRAHHQLTHRLKCALFISKGKVLPFQPEMLQQKAMFALPQSPLSYVQSLFRARMTTTGTVCNLSQKKPGQQKANISSGKTANNIYLIKRQRWVNRTEADASYNA